MAYSRTLLFISCFLFNNNAFAILKDPTKPFNHAVSVINSSHEIAEVTLKLVAVFISQHSKHATINGVTAKEGQLIFPSVKVIKILKNSVKVQYKGINQTLYLLTPFKKKQVDIKQELPQ